MALVPSTARGHSLLGPGLPTHVDCVRDACREAGVRPSIGSVGDAYDNTVCESFFATLECELLDRRPFKKQIEARMAVFDFIEGWCNPHRRHSSLDYLSRMNCELRAGAPVKGESDQPSSDPE